MPCRCNNLCNCIVLDGLSTTVTGNGGQSTPYGFRPTLAGVPFPRPYGRIYQPVAPVDGSPVNFSLERGVGDGNMTNLVAFPSRLTAPADGLYLVGASWDLDGADSVFVDDMFIRLNGVTEVVRHSYTNNATNTTFIDDLNSMSTLLDLNTGDYIELIKQRTVGASNSVWNAPSYFWAEWLGGPI